MNINAAPLIKQDGLKSLFTEHGICQVPANFPAKLQTGAAAKEEPDLIWYSV